MHDFQGKPLAHAVSLYLRDDLPAWGPAEEETEPIPEIPGAGACPASYPGNGLAEHPMLWVGEGDNRMFLIVNGRIRWVFHAGKGWEYDDVWMLTSGRILFSHMYWAAEITPDKRFTWHFKAPEGSEIHTLQPVGEDHALMVLNSHPLPRALFVNTRSGAVEWERPIPYPAPSSVHGQFRRFRLTAEGTYLAPCLEAGVVLELDRDFREIWRYELPGCWAAARLENGNTLVTGEKEGVHREVDRQGRTVWEIRLEDLPEEYRPAGSQSCCRLHNGNTIVCSRGGNGATPQVIEVTLKHEIVWVLKDWKHLGPCTALQILDEPGIPEQPGACFR